MDRPVLSIQTIYFDDSEAPEAQRLGTDLYNLLTRPTKDPLGYGAGIPVQVGVRFDRVNLDAADRLVLIPVLGKVSFLTEKDATMQAIRSWHQNLTKGLVLPMPLAAVWRSLQHNGT